MSTGSGPLRTAATERLAAAALFGCAAASLASLPTSQLAWPWLVAFTLPAAVLGRSPGLAAWPVRRALGAMALQTAACFVALHVAGPLSRPAALACTILPPLAYVAVRRRDTDAALGLFLSFCVLLVGTILGGLDVRVVLAFGFFACLALRCETLLAAMRIARSTAGAPQGTAPVLRSATTIALACLVVTFGIQRSLGLLPSPSRDAPTAAASAAGRADQRGVGLDDSFVLDGSGVLSDLTGEQLVRVRADIDERVPHDLYLRSGFFADPGLDEWRIGTLQLQAAPADTQQLRRPRPGTPVEWLEIERFAGAQRFVLMPPGTCEVRELGNLLVDPSREYLRQPQGGSEDSYVVGFQRLPPPLEQDLDPRSERLGLFDLPRDLDPTPFASLLARWRARGEPLQVAARIEQGLARHCRYDRSDPTGPHRHAIENFLFAEADRHGYCMHFASAAALLLRMNGVPCRIGVGLYGGAPDPSDATARLYGSQHAHAWVEIPFATHGYFVFDPTPPTERGQPTPRAAERDASATGDAATGADLLAMLRHLGELLTQPWLLAAVLLLIVASTLRPTRRLRPPAATAEHAARSTRRMLGRVLREIARAGHPRAPRQTLEMFARSLADSGRLLPEFDAAFRAYQEVRFGGRDFDADRQALLQQALAAATALPDRSTAAGP